MGRTGRRAAKTAVVGATPMTDSAGLSDLIRSKALENDLRNADRAAPRVAKVKTSQFFTVPPRTEMLHSKDDGSAPDTFKENPVKPVGLGEISAGECTAALQCDCCSPAAAFY